MTRFRHLFIGLAALAFATVAANAQTPGKSILFSPRQGDLVFPITPPNASGSVPGTLDNMEIGSGTPRKVTSTQLLGPWGTAAKNPASSTYYPSYTFGNTQGEIVFSGNGTASYAYVTMSPSPGDNMRQCVFSAGQITTLYATANAGQTLVGTAFQLAANSRACWTYSAGDLVWTRSQ